MEAELFADTRRNVAKWSVFNLWSLACLRTATFRTRTCVGLRKGEDIDGGLPRWSGAASDNRVDGITLVQRGMVPLYYFVV